MCMYWCFWTMVLEKTLESPLDCKEVQPVHPKGDQSWVSTGRTDVEAEIPVLWPPDANSWLIWKDPVVGKDWGQEEKGTTEDEMVGWHHWLNEHGFGWTPGVGDGQGGLVCCGSWVTKSQTWLSDWTELNWIVIEILQRTFTGFSGFYPLTYIVFSSLDSLDKDYWDHCPSSSLFFFFFSFWETSLSSWNPLLSPETNTQDITLTLIKCLCYLWKHIKILSFFIKWEQLLTKLL